MNFFQLWHNCKTLSQKKWGPCIHNQSKTDISTFLVLWNQQPPKCCFSSPINRTKVPSETGTTSCLSDIYCVGWRWRITPCNRLFGPLWEHWVGSQLHSSGMWKWLFVNCCKCKGPVSTIMEFLNTCKDELHECAWGIMPQNNDISVK